MNKNDILVCITNYNSNENAINLKNNFSKYFETIIIDSKSDIIEENFDIKLENVYYTGLVNESINQCKLRNKKYLFFIASDVYYEDYEKVSDLILNLDEDVYLWSPSSKGQSHYHCKNFKTNSYREVPYLEGFCFFSHIDCCDFLYPISMENNKYGYGIDLLLGYYCIKILKKKCVIDDRVEIYHREGTGYDQNKALEDMHKWMLSDFDDDVKKYTILYSKSWDSRINSSDYNKLLEYLKNNKKFTIGYIDHDKEVFDRLLGPSLNNLKGEFDIIKKSDSNFPAYNYNKIIEESKTPYVILTHQDVTFSPDLLLLIEKTMESINYDFGSLGMVGVDVNRNYRWSKGDIIYEVDTLDCCFIVIKKEHNIRFDEVNFGEYHLYVEDYCAQVNRILNKKNYTILIPSSGSKSNNNYNNFKGSFLNHHSATLSKKGSCWGRYWEFRKLLEIKWPGIKTT